MSDWEGYEAMDAASGAEWEREEKLRALIERWRTKQSEAYAGAGFAVAYDAIGDLLDELEEALS